MSIRVNTNVSLKDRKEYTFDNFKGVDFSTSPYKVAQYRSIQAENLMYDNGTVRKRNGWKSICKLDGKINGLFSFELENEKFVLAYAGTKFYRLTWNKNTGRFDAQDLTDSCTYPTANLQPGRLVERRIQVYLNKEKAYIVGCGDYLVLGKWGGGFEIRRVFDNEDTYIPTTSINIDNDKVNDETRATLDDVNILSSWRRNELVGVDEESATWTLDTATNASTQAVDENSDITIHVYTLDEQSAKKEIVINNRITDDKTKLYTTDNDINSVGSIDFASGKLTLTINTKPQEADTSNIVVLFKCSAAGQADIICNGTISTVFGGGGNSNRLFISGNKAMKNTHVWSEMYDFTYFADTNFDELGSDSSAIMGYVRASDGVLLVFKEKNGSDATIYYVSGTDTEEEDSNGDMVFVTKFTKFAGNITDTILGKYATASLNGDNLILTRNGVRGLEMYDNITTSAYRVRERSRNINAKLLQQEGLADACGYVFKDKYYLSMDNVVYICDSRFTFQADEDISDSFNYEWWYFTNIDARVWCEIDNELYFGTNSGLICKFYEDYADMTYQDTEAGDITIAYNNNNIAYNMQLERALTESSSIKFTQGDVFALYIDTDELLSIDEEGYIHFPEEIIYKIYDGVEFYVDRTDETGLETDKEYHIGVVDLDNLRFPILDSDNKQVIPNKIGFRCCKKVSGKELLITNINDADKEFQVKEFKDAGVLDLVIYNYTMPTELLATICFKENVKAVWYTPICDFGTNMFSKTLLGLTITTEPLVKGAVTVGYQTRNIEKDFLTHGTHGFDFNDIDFADFSFESSFTSSNTLRVKERNFNFIIIRYISDNQGACAVNGITVRYKINRLNKGVR